MSVLRSLMPPESAHPVGIDGEADYLVEVVHGSAATGYGQKRCRCKRIEVLPAFGPGPEERVDGAVVRVGSDPIGALAHLQIGRAFSIAGDTSKTAYQDFFTLWRDADLDIPILKQARDEYTSLD
jgi:hypothetical protein